MLTCLLYNTACDAIAEDRAEKKLSENTNFLKEFYRN